MTVPFLDLVRQQEPIADDVRAAVDDVLSTQHCIGGPHVERLEGRLADRVGVAHAVGVSSGTDALLVALMALGIGEGDEVITTPFTFFAPVECIMRLGAKPVFVDIEPETFNLDAERVEDAITERTKAILPVHLFGQTCDMTTIGQIADDYDLAVVEDMAQAIDATHRGRPAGSFGTAGCLSFYPTKNLGGAGDGGMVFCDDDQFAERIRRLCRHGADPKYYHHEMGGNFRLDAIQAAILDVKLDHLEGFTAARREHARYYDGNLEGIEGIAPPKEGGHNRSVYNQYTIQTDERDGLRNHLSDAGVGTAVYYPEPLHTQPVMAGLGYEKGDFPQAERACRQVLSLPVFPELTPGERNAVVDAMKSYPTIRS